MVLIPSENQIWWYILLRKNLPINLSKYYDLVREDNIYKWIWSCEDSSEN